jgi:multiple sugar transport system substrate-binding protein
MEWRRKRQACERRGEPDGMATLSRRRFVGGVLSTAALPPFLAGCRGGSQPSGAPAGGGTVSSGGPLRIVWAKWDPADYLQVLSDDFKKATGTEVVVDQVPWSSFQDKVFTAFAGKDSTYDIVIGDSQWLGKGATEGHYVELTDWMKSGIDMTQLSPRGLKYYGEYPKDSGKYYAMPAEADAAVFAYRTDLFEDPREKDAFQKKYGRPLAVPKTWAELRDLAQFFTRPNNQPKPLYGLTPFYSREYDAVTMGYQPLLWGWGGSWGNEKTYQVEGVLNTQPAYDALQFYVDLKPFTPPGSEKNYFVENNTLFQQGNVAIAENWFAFMPALMDPKLNPHADKTGYFISPAGPKGHYISLGGQGMSISSYSKEQDAAKQYLQWFAKEETQKKWAQLGGLTNHVAVLKSQEFLSARPYNKAFAETFNHVRDFWAVPEYAKLLESCQKNLNAAVVKQLTPKQALDNIARECQAAFKAAGYPKA